MGGSWTGSATSPLGPHYGGGSGAYDPNVGPFAVMQGHTNTGGGGGGGNNGGPVATGGCGGSGILMIAYPDT